MSTAMSIVRTLLGLLFDHTIGNIVRMIPIIRLPKLERGPVSRGFLALLLGILFFGLTMLFSASYSSAYATSGKLYSIIKPQVMIAIVGLFFMWVLSNINYRALRLMSESLYIITVVLLILTLLSPEDTNGTYRWVYLPGGASFQPSELAKFSLMLWTADMLDRDYDKKNRLWYGAIKPALPLLLILYLLHKESHNSGMILLCLIFATMLVCTLSPGRWLLLLIPAGVVVGAYFLKGLASGEGYAAGRMDAAWGLAPLDTAGMLWQTRQSIYAISTGGMFGVGIGASVQKHQWLPYAENDFIFGVIGEELGFFGCVILIGAFAVLLIMGVMIALRAPDLYGMVLGIGALILPLAFGEWNNGAKNWVKVPLLGSFQPSEIVKLSVVLALAYFFSAHRTVWQMMPALVFAAACLLLLMMQRALGTALIYYLTTLVLFYVACGNVPLTGVGLGGGVGAAALGYQMFAHVKVRVAMWRNPWSDPTDKGYQIIQALLAIGSGGLFGVGLGQGTPEKIPAYYNDFIFAVFCEQLGQVFGVLLLAVYVLLILRGVTVVARARRSFEMLLGCGVLAMLGIQTFMIVAGVIKMIPLTGVTMPFLSYGGSSLLSCMAMIGILHGASARAQENLEEDILCVKG